MFPSSPGVRMSVIKMCFCTSPSPQPLCEAGTGSCWYWQSTAVTQTEMGWFGWCWCSMHFAGWDGPTIKAEGRLVGRGWKSGKLPAQHFRWITAAAAAVRVSLPVTAVSLSDTLLWWCWTSTPECLWATFYSLDRNRNATWYLGTEQAHHFLV